MPMTTEKKRCRYTRSGVCANIAGECLCQQNAAMRDERDEKHRERETKMKGATAAAWRGGFSGGEDHFAEGADTAFGKE